MEKVVISIASAAENGLCVAAEDGEKIYQEIKSNIDQGKSVQLTFEGVKDLTSSFLNTAVGQLYGKIDGKVLKEKMLPPIEASQEDLGLLKRVVERAIDFFKDPERYKKAANEALGEDDE